MASTDIGMPTVGPLQSAAPYPLRLVLNWGRRYSLWVFNFGLACCAIEFIAASTSRHDFIRLGVIPFAHGPRQADLMIVSGTVTDKMAPAVRRLYEQMPEPKYVISFGACSNSGGPYWDSYCVTKGVDQIIPVDVYVPGCPPRPQALLQAVVKLQEKIAGENLARRYRRRSGSQALSAAEATRPLVPQGRPTRRAAGKGSGADGGRSAPSFMPSTLPPASVQAVTLRPHMPVDVPADFPVAPVTPAVPVVPVPPVVADPPPTAEDTADLPTSVLAEAVRQLQLPPEPTVEPTTEPTVETVGAPSAEPTVETPIQPRPAATDPTVETTLETPLPAIDVTSELPAPDLTAELPAPDLTAEFPATAAEPTLRTRLGRPEENR